MEGRRKSLLDTTRNSNFLRRSIGTASAPCVLTREEYLTVLRREKAQWKTLCSCKKKEVKRTQPDVIIERDEVLASLNDEDRAFLNERPNYLSFAKNANDYVQQKLFYKNIEEQRKKRLEMLKENNAEEIDAIVDKLLLEETEPCLVCNNGLCTRELHQLLGKETIISEMLSCKLQIEDW